MKRDFKGIWIPSEIWLDKNLSVMEKLFLVEIDSLDNEKGCFASNGHFSDFFQISKGRCSQIIKSLEQKGLVKSEIIREGNIISMRILRVVNKLNTLVNKLNTPIKKTKGGYLENAQGNNTYINNTLLNKESYIEWLTYRLETKKKPVSETAQNKLIKKLSGYSKEDQKWVIDNSIENDWQGLFFDKLKGDGNGRQADKTISGQPDNSATRHLERSKRAYAEAVAEELDSKAVHQIPSNLQLQMVVGD
jgi:hypothetical protein